MLNAHLMDHKCDFKNGHTLSVYRVTVYIAKFTSKFSWQTLTPPGRPLRLCLPRLSKSRDQQLNNYCLNQINKDIEVAHPLSGPPSTWLLVELEFGNVGFWGDGKTGVIGEKPFGGKERTNRPRPQPTCRVDTGTWVRITLVGGECSQRCATLVPQLTAW